MVSCAQGEKIVQRQICKEGHFLRVTVFYRRSILLEINKKLKTGYKIKQINKKSKVKLTGNKKVTYKGKGKRGKSNK